MQLDSNTLTNLTSQELTNGMHTLVLLYSYYLKSEHFCLIALGRSSHGQRQCAGQFRVSDRRQEHDAANDKDDEKDRGEK